MESHLSPLVVSSSLSDNEELGRSTSTVSLDGRLNQSGRSSPPSWSVAQNGQADLLSHWAKRSQTRAMVRFQVEAKIKVWQVVRQYQVSCFLNGSDSANAISNQSVANALLQTLNHFPGFAKVPKQIRLQWLSNVMCQGQPYFLRHIPVAPGDPRVMTMGYFKADKKRHQHAEPKETLVRAASGKSYALLNSLRKESCTALLQTFGAAPKPGKYVLGQGGNGKVRLAQEVQSKEILSVKKTYGVTRAPKELVIGQKVVRAYEARFGKQSGLGVVAPHDYFYREVSRMDGLPYKNYFFMPLVVGSDLSRVIFSAKINLQVSDPVFMKQLTFLFARCSRLVANLHLVGFSHRDIKSNNFMYGKTSPFDVTPKVLLCDFDLATSNDNDNKKVISTPFYSPPEFFDNSPFYSGQLHDAFSLGVDMLAATAENFSYTKPAIYRVRLPALALEVPIKVIEVVFQGQLACRCTGVSDDVIAVLAGQPNSYMKIMLELLAQSPINRITASQAATRLENLT